MAGALVFHRARLAERFGLELRGDAGACALRRRRDAGQGRRRAARVPRQSALPQPAGRQPPPRRVVLRAADADGHAGTALIASDPYVAFAKIAALFEPPPAAAAGHPCQRRRRCRRRRSIRSAQIGPFVSIGARSAHRRRRDDRPGLRDRRGLRGRRRLRLVARVTLVQARAPRQARAASIRAR